MNKVYTINKPDAIKAWAEYAKVYPNEVSILKGSAYGTSVFKLMFEHMGFEIVSIDYSNPGSYQICGPESSMIILEQYIMKGIMYSA